MLLQECQNRGYISWPEKYTQLACCKSGNAFWLVLILSLSFAFGQNPPLDAGGFLKMICLSGDTSLSEI